MLAADREKALPASRHQTAANAIYQMRGTVDSGRTIGSPGLQLNAAANAGMFDTGPFVRQTAGA
jgi:hypothetical protein